MTEKLPGQELHLFDDQPTPLPEGSVGEDGVIFRSPEDEHDYDIGVSNLTEVATTRDEAEIEADPVPIPNVTTVAQPPEITTESHHKARPAKRRIRHTSGRDHGYSHEGSNGESVPFELR